MKKSLVLYLILALISRLTFGQANNYSTPSGTTIVAFITKDTIWLGTDSKIRNIIDGKNEGFQIACKIREFHNIFIAMSGVPSFINNGDTLWSAYNDVVKQLAKDTSLLDTYHVLAPKIKDILTQLYGSYIQNRSDLEVSELFKIPNHVKLQITISGFNKRRKPFHANWLYYLSGNKLNWQILFSEQTVIDGDTREIGDLTLMSFAGHTDSILHFLHSPIQRDILQPKPRKDRMAYLIGLEIAKDSTEVGRPINIVAIYPNGHRWLTRNNVCKLVGAY